MYIKKYGGLWNVSESRYSYITMLDIMGMDFTEVREYTEELKQFCSLLDDKFKDWWIAKDKNGIFICKYCPKRNDIHDDIHGFWESLSSYNQITLFSNLFSFLKWEDDPVSIADVLKSRYR